MTTFKLPDFLENGANFLSNSIVEKFQTKRIQAAHRVGQFDISKPSAPGLPESMTLGLCLSARCAPIFPHHIFIFHFTSVAWSP
jgi:hypothetical protein